MSNYLSTEKRAQVVAMLCEGMGIRATARVMTVDRGTVTKIGREVGEGYARLHDRLFVKLVPTLLELDEAWSFVHTKQGHLPEPDVRTEDQADYGDQYLYIGLDADKKAILAYHVGRRSAANTRGFLADLASRVITSPQITTDGFAQYKVAISQAFGPDADYAMCIKEYLAACSVEASVRYQPNTAIHVEKIIVSGAPDPEAISTAFVERQNLTLRMLTKRFARLSNGFSKNLRNHRAAVDLYVGYYNFCWKRETLGMTPAMAAGVVKEVWTAERYMTECMKMSVSYPPTRIGERGHEISIRDRNALRSAGRAALAPK